MRLVQNLGQVRVSYPDNDRLCLKVYADCIIIVGPRSEHDLT